MKSQLKMQAYVVPMSNPDPSGTVDKVALFNEDGSPFSMGSSGPTFDFGEFEVGGGEGNISTLEGPIIELPEDANLTIFAVEFMTVDFSGSTNGFSIEINHSIDGLAFTFPSNSGFQPRSIYEESDIHTIKGLLSVNRFVQVGWYWGDTLPSASATFRVTATVIG